MSIVNLMDSDECIRLLLSEWRKKKLGKHNTKLLDIVVERAYNQYRNGGGVPFLNQMLEREERK